MEKICKKVMFFAKRRINLQRNLNIYSGISYYEKCE